MKCNKCHIISSRDGNRVLNAWKSLSRRTITSPTAARFKHSVAKLKLTLYFVHFFIFAAGVSAVSCCLCVLST